MNGIGKANHSRNRHLTGGGRSAHDVYVSTTTLPHEILNVRILRFCPVDQPGVEVADIDAPSTAEALAYFMRSRHLDENATEAKVLGSVAPDLMLSPGWRTAPCVAEERDFIGRSVADYRAEIH